MTSTTLPARRPPSSPCPAPISSTTPDLEHHVLRNRIQLAEDLLLQVPVDQEVLAERPLGTPMPGRFGSHRFLSADSFAAGRQAAMSAVMQAT
jgi:hypothetical protein